jgi:hypothetical protein
MGQQGGSQAPPPPHWPLRHGAPVKILQEKEEEKEGEVEEEEDPPPLDLPLKGIIACELEHMPI